MAGGDATCRTEEAHPCSVRSGRSIGPAGLAWRVPFCIDFPLSRARLGFSSTARGVRWIGPPPRLDRRGYVCRRQGRRSLSSACDARWRLAGGRRSPKTRQTAVPSSSSFAFFHIVCSSSGGNAAGRRRRMRRWARTRPACLLGWVLVVVVVARRTILWTPCPKPRNVNDISIIVEK
jgi:hypothetical protein